MGYPPENAGNDPIAARPQEDRNIAVRDVVMAIAASTLARLAELRHEAPAIAFNHVVEDARRHA